METVYEVAVCGGGGGGQGVVKTGSKGVYKETDIKYMIYYNTSLFPDVHHNRYKPDPSVLSTRTL